MVEFPSDFDADKMGFMPICGVVAAAILTRKTVAEVFDHFKQRRGSKWRGGLTFSEYRGYIQDNSEVRIDWVDFSETKKFKGKSLSKFMSHHITTNPNQILMIRVTGHVIIVHDRFIYDQTGKTDFMKYHFRQKRVKSIFKISGYLPPVDTDVIEFKDEEIYMAKKVSKAAQVETMVRALISEGKPYNRKDVLAKITADYDTTWGAASSFYHAALRKVKKEK